MAISYFNADFLKILFFTHFWIFWTRKWSKSFKNWYAASSEYYLKNHARDFWFLNFFWFYGLWRRAMGQKTLKNGIFLIFGCRKIGKNWKIKNPLHDFLDTITGMMYTIFQVICTIFWLRISKNVLFLGQKNSPMFYIGISAERERCSYVPDHNFWTVAQKLKYDSSLERGKVVLKHTKKANWYSKKAIYLPLQP